MPNYFLNHFSTGLKETHSDASLSLEAFIVGLDSTNNPIIQQGISVMKRGGGRFVGWALFEDYFSAYHLHFADNIELTVT